jgi:hypothetical protein
MNVVNVGCEVRANRTAWYSESGVLPKNTIVRLDPRTETFASTTILSGGGVVRNMAVTPDGRSGVNKVGVVMANKAQVHERDLTSRS